MNNTETAQARPNPRKQFTEAVCRAVREEVREVALRVESGRLETVELLAIGHVGFAYRVPGTERRALALHSPRQATGYRWTEAVTAAEAAAIDAAIEATQRGDTRLRAPLDVSGRLELRSRTQSIDPTEWIAAGGPVMWPLVVLLAEAWLGGPPWTTASASLAAIAGLYFYEHAYVMAPQEVPNS